MKNKLFVFISSFIAIVLCSVNLATAAVNHGIISVASTAGNITVNGNTFDNLQITPSLVFNQTGDSITYQKSLESLGAMNCEEDSSGFYDKLVQTRTERQTVAQDIVRLRNLMKKQVEMVTIIMGKIK